jgi:hypothetical protein
MNSTIRQDLQDYQDIFCIVWRYPVHLACPAEGEIDLVRKIRFYSVKFFIRLN